jgi:hypothetical protein
MSHWIRVAFVLAAVLVPLVLAAPCGSDTGRGETVKPARKGEVIALKAVSTKSSYAVRHARCAERLSDL